MAIERAAGLTGSVAAKPPCRVATTEEIVLNELQIVNGIALVEGNRVLVKDQTTASENGIYIASAGAWYRAYDFNGPRDAVRGTLVFVNEGTTNPLSMYRLEVTDPVVFGTSAISFVYVDATAAAAAAEEAAASAAAAENFYNQTLALYNSINALVASLQIASNGDYASNAHPAYFLPSGVIWNDATFVGPTFQAPTYWAPDLSTGINFYKVLTGGVGLDTPINGKPGQSGAIMLVQGNGGPHLISYGTGWLFPKNSETALSTLTGSIDVLWYTCVNTTTFTASLLRAYGQ